MITILYQTQNQPKLVVWPALNTRCSMRAPMHACSCNGALRLDAAVASAGFQAVDAPEENAVAPGEGWRDELCGWCQTVDLVLGQQSDHVLIGSLGFVAQLFQGHLVHRFLGGGLVGHGGGEGEEQGQEEGVHGDSVHGCCSGLRAGALSRICVPMMIRRSPTFLNVFQEGEWV